MPMKKIALEVKRTCALLPVIRKK